MKSSAPERGVPHGSAVFELDRTGYYQTTQNDDLPSQQLSSSHLSKIMLDGGPDPDLFEAALAIAADRYPNLDLARYRDLIRSFAAKAAAKTTPGAGAKEILLAINSVLFDELGFTGNTGDYYDPRNSYLNQVLDRRTGIPISLSVVYIAVGQCIAISLKGVGMPFHFLVKCATADGDVFIDPFNGGTLMDADGCASLFARLSGGVVKLLPEHLAEVPTKLILIRMLANLVSIYRNRLDYTSAIETIDRILFIDGKATSYVRDRAAILSVQGRLTLALREYERYLALSPDAADAREIASRLSDLRQRIAALN